MRDNRPLRGLALTNDIICQPLGSLPHRVNIHPVRAGPDHAPETSCPESQRSIKPVFYLLLILTDRGKLFLRSRVKIWILHPLPVYIFVTHSSLLLPISK